MENPNSKFQTPNKFQHSNSNEAHLELGTWNLELTAPERSL